MFKYSLFLFFIFPIPTFAFFCPTNFNQINDGDTINQVIQACGAPTNQKEFTKENNNVPQEWVYYIPQTVSTETANQAQGTLKTSITFDDKGKAINVSVNGLGVGSSTICGAPIQLGDSQENIKAACGNPAFINKQGNSGSETSQKTSVIVLIYGSSQLTFENGKLTENK